MIAIMPVERGEERRVVVDAPLLLGLSSLWLDRLTLTRTIRPLTPIVLALAATLALFAYGANGKWEPALAAGTTGALAIQLVQYLVRVALSPLVDGAVAAATAAIEPPVVPKVIFGAIAAPLELLKPQEPLAALRPVP
jgi:glucose-6-phosphate-specific signal transduction histidine kinase